MTYVAVILVAALLVFLLVRSSIGMNHNEIDQALAKLEEVHGALDERWRRMMLAYEDKFYGVDLLASAALNRTRANVSAFSSLIRARNLVIAGVLLRLQIDLALRFYATFLVKDPHDFSMMVLKGERIDKVKDRDGNRLQDWYLVSKLKPDFHWLERVYKKTSGYVHLSGTHIYHTMSGVSDDGTLTMKISDLDADLPEELYLEAIEAFGESIKILLKYVDGWTYTKANPDQVERLRREMGIE